ncbi:MAG: glycosyltransferase, partial [Chloroflexi bacterium]|nr:glycosyltransferase [Chloroflexota bacterium]
HKQLDIALRAFDRFRQKHAEAVYLLVGPTEKGFDLAGTIQSMGLQDTVRMAGWQAPPDFVRHMFVADVAVHLRYPHVGGTPYTPIRLMGLGIPTIVTNIEPLAEIPEGCCIKIDVDEHEEETLVAMMDYLATHEEARRRIAEKGRRHILEEHHPRRIAQQYKAFIEQIQAAGSLAAPAREPPVDWQQYLIEEVAGVLADWGVYGKEEGLLLPIAEAIASLGLGPKATPSGRTASTEVSD